MLCPCSMGSRSGIDIFKSISKQIIEEFYLDLSSSLFDYMLQNIKCNIINKYDFYFQKNTLKKQDLNVLSNL